MTDDTMSSHPQRNQDDDTWETTQSASKDSDVSESEQSAQCNVPQEFLGRRNLRLETPNHNPGMLRLIRAYLYDVWSLMQDARVPLLGFVILTMINVGYLTLFYRNAPCTNGQIIASELCHLSIPRAFFETLRMYVFEINLEWPEHDLFGQALFFITPILGVALIFQSVLDFSRHLLDKGVRREAWQVALAKTYHNHVIICGLGRVAYRIMSQLLQTGYDVVVVEKNWTSEFVVQALKLKVPVVLGNATDPDILRQAGIARARGIITGTSNDLQNIEIALAARRERDDIQVVMRIFNDELDYNLERSFGRNTAFSSSALGAPTMAVAAVSCSIAYVLPLADTVLGISEITVAPGSLLTGFALTIETDYHVRIVQWIQPDGKWGRPQPGLRLEGGDVVLLIGTIEALEAVSIKNQPNSKFAFLGPQRLTRPVAPINTVIVCGLGKVGYRVVKALYARIPRPDIVIICDERTKGPFLEEIHQYDLRIVHGDARIPDVLNEAGIASAYSVAAVTSDNLTNIQIGLVARRLRPDIDVVLRVFSAVLAEQLDSIFGTYTAFSTSALAAPTMAAAAIEPHISYALQIGGHFLSTIEIIIHAGDEFVGKTVEEVHQTMKYLIVALRRDNERTFIPALDTVLLDGDHIELFTDIALIPALRPKASRRRKVSTRKLVIPPSE